MKVSVVYSFINSVKINVCEKSVVKSHDTRAEELEVEREN